MAEIIADQTTDRQRRIGNLGTAARGYAGCEVLAVSNWLLHRDDQVGCVVFGLVDYLQQ